MAQRVISSGEGSMFTVAEYIHPITIGWYVLEMSTSYGWFIVLFNTVISLLNLPSCVHTLLKVGYLNLLLLLLNFIFPDFSFVS